MNPYNKSLYKKQALITFKYAILLGVLLIFTNYASIHAQNDTLLNSRNDSLNDMSNPVLGKNIMEIPWGNIINSVGSHAEDKSHNTDGFPPAFDQGSDKKLYILDSANSRIMISQADNKLALLFNYPQELCATDISVSPDIKKIALADQNENSVFIFNPKGEIIKIIEAVYPSSLSYTNNDKLLIHNYKSDTLMIFNANNNLLVNIEIEGTSPKPIKGIKNKLYKIDKPGSTPILKELDLDGLTERKLEIPLLFHQTKNNYYHCNSNVIGADEKGCLYIEHLIARDIDKNHERHLYIKAILCVDIKTWKITSKVYVKPYKEMESLVSPRDYQPHSDGGVLTYDVDLNNGYSINHIEKKTFTAVE